MSAQHAPGPWRVVNRAASGGQVKVYAADGRHIATVWAKGDTMIGRAANALLIGAAPGLLATLRTILDELSGTYDGTFADALSAIVIKNAAEEAIARATTPQE